MSRSPSSDPLLVGLGKAIRSRRQAMGLTLEELASRAGLARGTVAHIETARSAPSLGSLLALSIGLGTRCATLLAQAQEG